MSVPGGKGQQALGGKFQHLCQTEDSGNNIGVLVAGRLYLLNQNVGPVVVNFV